MSAEWRIIMFQFKKSMAGVTKEDNFECSCCGATNDQSNGGGCGCSAIPANVPSDCGCGTSGLTKDDSNPSTGCGCGCSGSC
jgi:hypothetical protein